MSQPDFIPAEATPDFIPADPQAMIKQQNKQILARNQNKTAFEKENEPPSVMRGMVDPVYNYTEFRKMADRAGKIWQEAADDRAGAGDYSDYVPRVMADTARFAHGMTSPKNLAMGAATIAAPLPMAAYLGYQGGKEVLTPRQDNETEADALQRRLYGGSQAVGSAAGVEGVRTGEIPAIEPATIKAGQAMVRGGAKATNAVLEKAPGMTGLAAGEIIGSQMGHPHIGGSIGYVMGKDIFPKLRVPGENFGRAKVAAPAEPLEGEYVDTPEAAPVDGPPILHNEPLRLARPTGPVEAPYARGPGEVPADEIPANVAAGEENVLAGKQGVLVRPVMRLNRGPSRMSELMDDAGVAQDMQADLENAGRQAGRERMAASTLEATPKWQRVAQAKADAILMDAAAKNSNPLRGLRSPEIARPPEGPPGIVPDANQDLTPLLEESLRRLRAKKPKGQPEE